MCCCMRPCRQELVVCVCVCVLRGCVLELCSSTFRMQHSVPHCPMCWTSCALAPAIFPAVDQPPVRLDQPPVRQARAEESQLVTDGLPHQFMLALDLLLKNYKILLKNMKINAIPMPPTPRPPSCVAAVRQRERPAGP